MSKEQADEQLANALATFMSVKTERQYELSISYEISPEVFEIDPQVLLDEPFEAPHKYRLALMVAGDVVFDGFFTDLPKAMASLASGLRAKIADDSWVGWMGATESTWMPAGI